MGNRTQHFGIPIPYPRSANVDELFDWERFLHDAFIRVDDVLKSAIEEFRNINNTDILLASRIRVAGRRPITELLSELNTEGGGILYFPAGTYEINNTITVPANVRLMGQNALLRPSASFYKSGDNPMFSVAGDGVIFEGLTFDGHPSNSDVRVSAIATNGYETTVVRCRFFRMGYTAVDHRSTARNGRLRIQESRFEDCWGDCILTNLSLIADSVVFTHPSTSISTVAAYRGYGVGIKAETQAGRTLRMVLRNVEFDRLLRTAILLSANPSHPAYEVRINGVKVRQIGLSRFSNPSGEASAIGNDESLYGALIYVKSTASNRETDIGTVHISDFDVDEPYGFVVRFPADNSKRHYLSKGRYTHTALGWSGSNPFEPISLRLARAFVAEVEGEASKRHFTKQSTLGSYDVVFQNCRFSGAGSFGGNHFHNIWYINCAFSNTAPAPTGGWFIGCRGASQYFGDKVIACDAESFQSTSLHLGTFETERCFFASGFYASPKITKNGKLTDTIVRQSIPISVGDFFLDDYTMGGQVEQFIQFSAYHDGLVAGFRDNNRLSNNNFRSLRATLPIPRNLYRPSGITNDDFNIKVRISFSFAGGRSDLVRFTIRLRFSKHGQNNDTDRVLHFNEPLTTNPITANSIYNAEFTLPSNLVPQFPTNGGTMTLQIQRYYTSNENETVWVHGAEIIYPALLEE
jgi:hypothetical protein